jgi:hypothetical protein
MASWQNKQGISLKKGFVAFVLLQQRKIANLKKNVLIQK